MPGVTGKEEALWEGAEYRVRFVRVYRRTKHLWLDAGIKALSTKVATGGSTALVTWYFVQGGLRRHHEPLWRNIKGEFSY